MWLLFYQINITYPCNIFVDVGRAVFEKPTISFFTHFCSIVSSHTVGSINLQHIHNKHKDFIFGTKWYGKNQKASHWSTFWQMHWFLLQRSAFEWVELIAPVPVRKPLGVLQVSSLISWGFGLSAPNSCGFHLKPWEESKWSCCSPRITSPFSEICVEAETSKWSTSCLLDD